MKIVGYMHAAKLAWPLGLPYVMEQLPKSLISADMKKGRGLW